MRIDLKRYFQPGETPADIEKQIDLVSVKGNGEEMPIAEKSPLRLHFEGSKESLKMTGSVSLVLTGTCSRCLKPVPVSVEVTLDDVINCPGKEVSESSDTDPFMDGYELCADDLVNSETMLNLPVKILCKDDCKGLCSVCGQDLNLGECGCDRFVPDPRMAAIKEIFEQSKEV